MLELASFLYIKYINTNIQMPSYSFVNVNSKFWTFNDEYFGVCHHPSSTYLHKKACFTETYASNAYGMRDKERTKTADQQRVVILGDSFIEGWGNKTEDRLSNLLEAKTGKEVLNFGTSGGFGTIRRSHCSCARTPSRCRSCRGRFGPRRRCCRPRSPTCRSRRTCAARRPGRPRAPRPA